MRALKIYGTGPEEAPEEAAEAEAEAEAPGGFLWAARPWVSVCVGTSTRYCAAVPAGGPPPRSLRVSTKTRLLKKKVEHFASETYKFQYKARPHTGHRIPCCLSLPHERGRESAQEAVLKGRSDFEGRWAGPCWAFSLSI